MLLDDWETESFVRPGGGLLEISPLSISSTVQAFFNVVDNDGFNGAGGGGKAKFGLSHTPGLGIVTSFSSRTRCDRLFTTSISVSL